MTRRPPGGLFALSVFFAFGATMSGLSALLLAFPGTPLDSVWNLNPDARAQLGRLGPWAVALMAAVCATCNLAAIGVWRRAPWGRRLAIGILAVNLAGDVASAIFRSDPRTLIGIPIAGAMIAYLASPRVTRSFFHDKVGQ